MRFFIRVALIIYKKGMIKVSLLKEYGIKEDPRFKQSRKESLRIMCLVIFEFIWVYSFGYLGIKVNPNDYSYILGFPMWFFWAFLGAGVIFPIIAIILSIKIKDCSLTEESEYSLDNEHEYYDDKHTS